MFFVHILGTCYIIQRVRIKLYYNIVVNRAFLGAGIARYIIYYYYYYTYIVDRGTRAVEFDQLSPGTALALLYFYMYALHAHGHDIPIIMNYGYCFVELKYSLRSTAACNDSRNNT